MAQDGGASTISKEDAGIPVGPVDDAREFVCANDKHGFIGAGGNVLTRRLHTEQEAGAGCGKVEAYCIHCADLGLDEAGRIWKEHIRRAGRADDQIDLFGTDFGVLDRGLGRAGRKIACRLLRTSNAAFADAGAGLNPLIAGLNQLLKVGISHHAVRGIAAGANDGSRPDGTARKGIRWHGTPPWLK